jgi:thermitase
MSVKRPATVLVVAAVIACAAAPALGGSHSRSAHAAAQNDAKARIVVGFHGLSRAQQQQLLARFGAALRRHLPHLRTAAASVPAADRDAILARLRANTNITFAEVDRHVGLIRPRLGKRLRLAHAAKTPDDEGFSVQYSLKQKDDHDVDATNAWDIRTSCAKVAILDTGIDTSHKDLKDNLWRNEGEKPNNDKDDDHNGYVDDDYGVDLVRGHGSGKDKNGHGTHVAGIIAARGDNNRGVSGLCWKAKLISVRWMDADGRGYTSDAAEAIVYAVDQGARVINASYGSGTPTDVEEEAIAYAAKHDTLIVAAAGNDHKNDDKKPVYPAAYPDANVIAVAATDDHDHLADFSNYGKKTVDLAAPGDSIGSTYIDGEYVYMSGTSMAAPLVAATAAMLRKQESAPVKTIRKLLLNNVDDKKKLKDKVASGGRLNVRRSLAARD